MSSAIKICIILKIRHLNQSLFIIIFNHNKTAPKLLQKSCPSKPTPFTGFFCKSHPATQPSIQTTNQLFSFPHNFLLMVQCVTDKTLLGGGKSNYEITSYSKHNYYPIPAETFLNYSSIMQLQQKPKVALSFSATL